MSQNRRGVSCGLNGSLLQSPNCSNSPSRTTNRKSKSIDAFKIDKTREMHLTERIQIPFLKPMSEICELSDRLRKRAVFISRQLYFFRNGCYDKKTKCKRYHPLAKLYPDLAEQLLSFMKERLDLKLLEDLKRKLYSDFTLSFSTELTKKLRMFEFYESLYHFLKNESVYNNLNAIYSPLPQQVLKYVAQSWTSYYEAMKEWKIHPEKFRGMPKIPSIRRKRTEFLISIPGMFFNNEKYAKGIVNHYQKTKRVQIIKNKHRKVVKKISTAELKFPDKFLKNFPPHHPFPTIRIRTEINIKSIIEIRIVPKKSRYVMEVIYPKKIMSPSLDKNKGCILDLGVNNLIAITTNFGTQPVLVRGRKIKSRNQWMNKKIAKLKSIQMKGKVVEQGDINPETFEMARIRNARTNYTTDYFHKVSCFVINYCLTNKSGNLGIGLNIGWKQNVNLGRKTNQNFVYIPFAKLIHMIQYKAQLNGINVKIGRESHTSKCSAVDFESIEHHDKYMGRRGIRMRGRNKKRLIKRGKPEYKIYNARGLFRTKNGHIIHSDINASFNIGRVLFPTLFNRRTLSVENMLMNPISIEV